MSADTLTAGSPPPVRAPGADDPASLDRLVPGGSWQDTHEVLAVLAEGGGRWFRARNLATQAEEWLWVCDPGRTERRAAVWPRLNGLDCPQLQRTTACHPGADRVEVWAAAGGPTLRAWRAGRPEPGPAEVAALVRDLAAALAVLHGAGVGHFAVNPDNIAVLDRGADGLAFRLTGLEAAEIFENSGLINIAVDPAWAPPEAAGLFQHSPGPLLTTWDYWSLGRVVQEFILGHDVLDLLPAGVRTRMPPSLAGQAESLLAERETGTIRAGVVELMPALGRRETRLLRGLLCGAREARWGAIELAEWLAGGEPAEQYEAPRHRRFFRLDGRGYTIADAAQVLAGPARQAEAVSHVFAVEQPGTLAAFVEEARGHQAEADVMQGCRKLVDLPALVRFPDALRREAAAAVCLHALGRGSFRWRGAVLNEAALRTALQDPARFAAVSAELRILSLPLLLDMMRKHDATTADFLERIREGVEGAELLLVRHGWIGDRPQALWLAALEAPAALRARVADMHRRFALSSVKPLDAVFQTPHPTPAMQVTLAWADGAAEKYGFRTHEQVRDAELAQLARKGESLGRALFWHRLERALRAVPVIFGARWALVVAAVAIVAALAVHVPGPLGVLLGSGPLVILVGLRVLLNRWQARLVRRWTGETWTWRDGAGRCRREQGALVEREHLPGLETGVRQALAEIEQRRATLLGSGRSAALPHPPRQLTTWAGALLVWLLLLGIAAGSGWRTVRRPPDWAAHVASWQGFAGQDEDDREPADPRMSWPYRMPLQPDLKLSTAEVFAVTGDQEDQALARGRQLAGNYRPDTVTSLIAVYVPVDDRHGCLLLYDARKDKLVSQKGTVLNFVPMSRSWLLLEDEMVLFIEK